MSAPRADSSTAGPPIPAYEAVRLGLLAQLVPSVVHELNNSLAVLRGVLDILVQDTGDPSGRRAIEESIDASGLLARLSSFAKDDEDAFTTMDPAAQLLELGPLVSAFAKGLGVQLDLRLRSGVAHVRGRPRALSRRLVTLLLLLLQSAKDAGGRPRMHVRARTEADRLDLVLGATRRPDAPLARELEALFEGLRACLEAPTEVRCAVRRRPRAIGVRVGFPAHVLEPVGTLPAGRDKARVLLLGIGADHEDELVELLRDSGYAVVRRGLDDQPAKALVSAAADVALVDATLLSLSPSLLARLAETTPRTSPRILLLGSFPGLEGIRSIPNPCPPDELLRAVSREAGVV